MYSSHVNDDTLLQDRSAAPDHADVGFFKQYNVKRRERRAKTELEVYKVS